MVAGVKVSFGVVKDEVSPKLKEMTKEYKVGRRAINALEGNYKTWETAAIRAIRNARNETDKLRDANTGLQLLVKKGKITDEQRLAILKNEHDILFGISAQRKKDLATVKRLESAEEQHLHTVRAIGRLLKSNDIDRARAIELVTRDRNRRKKMGDDTVNQTRRWKEELRGVAASYVGITQAISTINQLIQRQIELSKEGLETRLTIAQGQQLFLTNTEGFTLEQRREGIARIKDITQRLGGLVSERVITEAFAKGISATSEGPRGRQGRLDDTDAATFAAARVAFAKPEQIPELTQAFLGFQKVSQGIFGGEESNQLLRKVISQSRLVEPQNIRQFVPALQAARTQAELGGGKFSKDDLVTASAFLAQLSSNIEDPTGELTRTAGALFASTLNKYVPDNLAKGFAEELEFAQGDSNLQKRIRQEIVENLEGRGIAKSSIQQILEVIGYGAGFGNVKEALTRTVPGPPTEELMQTMTKELQSQTLVLKARTYKEQQLEKKFGDSGAALEAVTNVLAPEGAVSEFTSKLQLYPAIVGTAIGDTLLGPQGAGTATQRASLKQLERLLAQSYYEGNEENTAALRDLIAVLKASIQQGSGAPPLAPVPPVGEGAN